LARLSAQVSQQRARTYPANHKGPHLWLDLVQGLIDTAQGYLHQANAPGISDAEAFSLGKDANLLGNNAYRFLQELEGAGADQIPHPVVGPFQRWVSGLGVNDSIFFRSDHVANYELATFPLLNSLSNLNSPSQSLLDAMAAITWPFRRVTVPSRAMGMLPHFAIVGHELGHAIQDRMQIDLKAYAGAFQDSAQKTAARLQADGIAFDQQIQLRRQDALRSWVNEIWSDAVGICLAGPALLFALGALFELTGGGWGLGVSHPPHIVRLRLALKRLQIGAPSHAEVYAAATGSALSEKINSPHVAELPTADVLYQSLKQNMTKPDAAIAVELIPVIEAIAADIYSEAERIVGLNPEMTYRPPQMKEDLSEHLDALCNLIPPIEYRHAGGVRAVSLAGVLNVGWAALLSKLNEFPATAARDGYDETAAKMEKLQELLLKAVELSEARRKWDDA